MNLMTACTSFPFMLGRVDSLGLLSIKKTSNEKWWASLGYGDRVSVDMINATIKYLGVPALCCRRSRTGEVFLSGTSRALVDFKNLLSKMEDFEIRRCFTFRQSVKRLLLQSGFDKKARKNWLLSDYKSDNYIPAQRLSRIDDFVEFVKTRKQLEDVCVCGDLTSFKPVFFIGHRCYQLVYRLDERSFVFRFEDTDKYVLVNNYWLDESIADFITII